MKNTDKQIWEASLDKEENSKRFETKVGGTNTKPLPKKEIFKSNKEKKLIERVKVLEKQVDSIIKEIKKLRAKDRAKGKPIRPDIP